MAQRNSFGDRWRQAVADARICGTPPSPAREHGQRGETCTDPAHCLPKGTRFHGLRHFYASTLIAANVNPRVIQARLGYATITETMDTYGHLSPDPEDLGRGAIEAIFAVTQRNRNGTRRAADRFAARQERVRGEPAYRPGSVPSRCREATVIHLGPPLPTASCGLPAGIGRAALERSRRPRPKPEALLTLLRVGFT